MITKRNTRLSIGGVSALVVSLLLALIIGLNCYTIVKVGTVKVQMLFGKVVDTPLPEGLHIVNPFKSFEVINTQNDKYEVNGLNIPTQDRFNTTGNITVLYRIDGSKGNYIRTNYGTAQEYIDKTLRQQLRSVVRDEGRKLADSRQLAQSKSVTSMQESIKARLLTTLDGTGIIINDVLVQDLVFDKLIAKQILRTQERIQKEEEVKSQERIATTNAKVARLDAEALGNKTREAAKANAFQITANAKANKEAAIAKASGIAESRLIQAKAEAQAIKLIADANVKLSKSLTPAILEKMRLENEHELYTHSTGQVPTTIVGDTDLRAIGVPVAATAK